MSLIDNWRSWQKMHSVQLMALAAYIETANEISNTLQSTGLADKVPGLGWLAVAVTVAAAVVRLIKQPEIHQEPKDDTGTAS